MAERVELPLEGGGVLVVKPNGQLDGASSLGVGPVEASRADAALRGATSRAGQSFSTALAGVASLATQARDRLSGAGPDEFTLEFGLEVDSAASVVLTSVKGACHVTVTMRWKADRDGR